MEKTYWGTASCLPEGVPYGDLEFATGEVKGGKLHGGGWVRKGVCPAVVGSLDHRPRIAGSHSVTAPPPCTRLDTHRASDNGQLLFYTFQSSPTLCNPHGRQPARLLCPWDSSGKNTGVGCHFLLQGILLTQGLKLGLPCCRQILYHLSHQGSPWWHVIVSRDGGGYTRANSSACVPSVSKHSFCSSLAQNPSLAEAC